MQIPRLKRIKVNSDLELGAWLAKNAGKAQRVMLVTCNRNSQDKYISSDQVRAAAVAHGWSPEQSYTLVGNLTGHVVSFS